MANPKLVVEVVGDSRKLTRTLKQTETQTQAFARRLGNITGSSAIGGFSNKGLFAGLIGAAGITSLKSVIDKSAEAQQVLGQTKVALDDSGLAWTKYADRINKAVVAQEKLGFDDEDLLRSFSTFVRATGDVDKALQLNALAADVARGRFIDLASATTIVLKASLGQAGALRRIGIDAQQGASRIQLLTLLTQKYGGAAEAAGRDASTQQERLRVSLKNVQEQIGSGLLPIVASFAGGLSDAADDAAKLVAQLQKIKLPGGGGEGLGTTLAKAFGDSLALGPKTVHAALTDLFPGKKLPPDVAANATAFGNSFGVAALKAAGDAAKSAAAAKRGDPFKNLPKVRTPISAEQRNTFFDAGIARQLDRVQDLQTVKQQVSALNTIAAEIQKRIDVTKDITRKLNLEDQLVAVQRQKRGVIAGGAEAARQAADAAKAAAEAAAAERKRIAEQAAALKAQAAAVKAAREQARQNVSLGDFTPSTANLRKQLASLTDRLASSGTALSSKLQQNLAGARKVLSGEFGKATEESRQKIANLFDRIRGEFDKEGKKGPLTKTTSLNADRLLDGLGLGRDAERALKARLSHFNSAGKALAGATTASAGAGGVNVVVRLDGRPIEAVVTTRQQQRTRRNPPKRTG